MSSGKKATAETAIGGGFFRSATAGMKMGGGFRRNSGDELNLYLWRTGSTYFLYFVHWRAPPVQFPSFSCISAKILPNNRFLLQNHPKFWIRHWTLHWSTFHICTYVNMCYILLKSNCVTTQALGLVHTVKANVKAALLQIDTDFMLANSGASRISPTGDANRKRGAPILYVSHKFISRKLHEIEKVAVGEETRVHTAHQHPPHPPIATFHTKGRNLAWKMYVTEPNRFCFRFVGIRLYC